MNSEQQKISDAVARLNRLTNLYTDQFDRDIARLNRQILDVQEMCSHEDTRYHPDASGNNDSYRSCNICGKEVKNLGIKIPTTRI